MPTENEQTGKQTHRKPECFSQYKHEQKNGEIPKEISPFL